MLWPKVFLDGLVTVSWRQVAESKFDHVLMFSVMAHHLNCATAGCAEWHQGQNEFAQRLAAPRGYGALGQGLCTAIFDRQLDGVIKFVKDKRSMAASDLTQEVTMSNQVQNSHCPLQLLIFAWRRQPMASD